MKTSKSVYLFLLPGLLVYLVFFMYPAISALVFSFTDWDGLSPQFQWVGLENYKDIIQDDLIFRKSFGNNLKFMIAVLVFQTAISLVLAMLLVKNSKANVFFRTLYFFPTILSSVAVAFTWSFMYDPTLGFINSTLTSIGLEAMTQSWLGNVHIAIYSIAFAQVWAHCGQMMVIFIAGLQAIPDDMYEVAKIEGANKLQTFTKVTWPLVAPAATIVVSYTTIQSFKAFDLIFAMTGGGPANSTAILTTFIYETAFRSNEFGYASAGSMIFMLIIILITVLQFKLLKGNRAAD